MQGMNDKSELSHLAHVRQDEKGMWYARQLYEYMHGVASLATEQILKQYLVQGYTLNQQHFEENALTLEKALEVVQKPARSSEFNADAGRGLVEIVSRYTPSLTQSINHLCERVRQGNIPAIAGVKITGENLC